ncbi:CHAT domain-containing tetratricopeptide repeat protein [uncultured Kordia sp.]|uniref:CHAT domain-containing protein n=1 Tax=uncultured Kordia sp. TaxID=507699 RepID=UPI0026378D09|nr:CHAT domain-containing tetratricopeptide repeat protein [uncultured Kordia sp.]
MIIVSLRIRMFFMVSFSLYCFGVVNAQEQLDLVTYYNAITEAKELSVNAKGKLIDSLLQIPNIKVDKMELAQIYYKLSGKNWKSNLKRSITYANKILKISDELKNHREEVFMKTYCNKVLFLAEDNQPYKALKASQQYLNLYKTEDTRLGKLFRLRGNVYSVLGDLQKSIENLDKSIFIFKSLNECEELTNTLISKFATYVLSEDKLYSNKIAKVIRELEVIDNKVCKFDSVNQIAKAHNEGYFYDYFLEDYSTAKIKYEKALTISIQKEDTVKIYRSCLNLAIVSKKEKNLEQAKEYLKKASRYSLNNHLKSSKIYNNQADIYQLENNHQQALKYYHKAITQALQSKELPYQTLPSFKDMELSPNKIDILGYLIDKANGWIAYDKAENNTEYLENALETFALADSLVDVIYVESREDLSKLFWRKKSATFYPKAVEVCYRLQQPEKAFFFMEKNKAILLLENMTDANAKRLSKLPKNILKREQHLIKKIKKLEGEIQISAYTESHIDSLKDDMFNYKKELNAFIDSLEINYPKYFKYKKNINVLTLHDVQKNLQKDELVLQYIVGKEKGFVTLISPETIQLKELPNTKELTKTVAKYKNAVSKPFVNLEDKNAYEEVATVLYEQLFPFAETFSQKRITIIPDGILQYIPFEALRTPAHQYLIENTQIHYNYSLSSAAQSQQNKMSSGKSFIAIAPTKFKDEQYATLTTSSAELEKLASIFGANHFQYENATKVRFTEAYGNYKIVHLSTHGGLENTIPWLAFYDEKITLDELYFTKNQSELVVLSACKTSDGELKKGEGVMSLARGFFNAGAKSVISSLWDINEKASNEIIQEFYKNIIAGDTKSKALQKAKLTYIQNNENTSEASPYYWSAFTLTGDANPINLSGNIYLYYIFGGILLTGIVVYIRRKRNKKEAA